jgi:hypothetical protein
LAAGAAAYKLTPGYGTNPAQLEPFSSWGQTPIMFTTSGQRLPTPVLLQKPDVVGPDGTGNLSFCLLYLSFLLEYLLGSGCPHLLCYNSLMTSVLMAHVRH